MSGERTSGVAFLTGYAGISILFFIRGYVTGDATFWMGMILIPFLFSAFPPGQKSWRMAPMVALIIIICCFRGETSFRFLLLICACLLVTETYFGKLNPLLFLTLLVASPIFKYVTEVFTFPIRLQITAWTGWLLQKARIPASTEGNSILLNGSEFSVDPACMGLQMTGFAIFSAIFLLTDGRKRYQRSLNAVFQAGFIALAFVLNILGNLIRIIMLVLLKIAPSNPMHDMTGIICLLVYVVMPLYFVSRYIYQRFAEPTSQRPTSPRRFSAYRLAVHTGLLLSCAFLCFPKPPFNVRPIRAMEIRPPGDYETNQLASGVVQFKNSDALVYVKPIPAFYSTEHSPATCWTGSGYHLGRVSRKVVGGSTVYIGTLKKGKEELFTAWWFSDGLDATSGQLDWRWRCLAKNRHYQLINVTSDNADRLEKEVKRWLPAS
ncbi:exosortase N [Dyadobacter sp. CY261]|uniref:exosortase N n=1 Tax=Dyadobacter sp. CY261 TaxID=2907203 RepID=UPI001F47A345|nr:exosortase N [Dyadobacter sp. CY261]MCF0073526.1 exosortase N [Dyadobacter sp. CY261]